MRILYAGHNQLTGEIPASIIGLTALRELSFHNNLLSGHPPAPAPNLLRFSGLICPNRLQAPSASDAAWNALANGDWSYGCSDTVYTVTASAGPHGQISPATQQRVHNGRASLLLKPDTGYEFDRIIPSDASACGMANSNNLPSLLVGRLNGNCQVTVTFKLRADYKRIITDVAPAGSGSFTCSHNPVRDGDDSTCTAVPNPGFELAGFEGCDSQDLMAHTCTLNNVQMDKTVKANFRATSTPRAVAALVPALGDWGLLLMGLLVAGLGLRALRRN